MKASEAWKGEEFGECPCGLPMAFHQSFEGQTWWVCVDAPHFFTDQHGPCPSCGAPMRVEGGEALCLSCDATVWTSLPEGPVLCLPE